MLSSVFCLACLAAVAAPPGAVHVWGPGDEGHKKVSIVEFSPDGTRLASGGGDRSVRLWDLETGTLRYRLGPLSGSIYGLSFSPDGRRLATGDVDLSLWDVESGALIRTMSGHRGPITCVRWFPTGSLIATGGRDKTSRLWDAATGENTATFRQRDGGAWVLGVEPLPDGRTLAAFTGRGEEPVAFWDLVRGEQTGGLARELLGPTDKLLGFAVSRDGSNFAFAGPESTIEIWRPRGNSPSVRLAGHTAEVGAVAFAPNGRVVASASVDDTVRLWDADAGKLIVTLAGHTGWVSTVAFAPDGRRLASGSGDNRVIVWDWARALEIEHAGRGGRPLDWEECWAALAGDDAARAHLAIWTLAARPEQALAFLAGKIAPTPHDDDQRAVVEDLVLQLEDDRPSVRREAVRGLEARLTSAESLLNSALAEAESLEVRHQLRALLAPDRPRTIRDPERLRTLRLVQVLEHIGDAEARARLRGLATGAPGDRVTQDARGALERLDAADRLRR